MPPSLLEIREADEAIENVLLETTSPKIAGIFKKIQQIKDPVARYASFQIVKILSASK